MTEFAVSSRHRGLSKPFQIDFHFRPAACLGFLCKVSCKSNSFCSQLYQLGFISLFRITKIVQVADNLFFKLRDCFSSVRSGKQEYSRLNRAELS